VVKILPNVLPDSIPHFPKEAHNAWILKADMINAYKIKMNDLVYTH
jgi:hypothetical protein